MMLRYSSYRFLRCIIGSVVAVMLFVLFLEVQPSKSQEVMDTTPASELKRLRTDLLKNYDKLARPVRNQSVPTHVRVLFDARHIVGLNEKYQTLTVSGQLMMKWTDEYMIWDPNSYSSINVVRFQPIEIWLPDIQSIYNVKAQDHYEKSQGSPVVVYSNGTVKWYPMTVYDVPCIANYRHYPFDSHKCSILFGAWSHSGDTIMLETLELPIKPSSSAKSSEWILTDATHTNVDMGVAPYFKYPTVTVELSIKRMSRIHKYICVVPTVMTIMSSLFGFWMLPNEGSRYMIGCCNVIITSLLLQYLAVTVPAGKEIPILAQYSATCLCMSGAFILVTVVTHHLRDSSGMAPKALLTLAHRYFDRFLGLSSFTLTFDPKDRVLRPMGYSDTAPTLSPDEEKRIKDWLYFSLFVDRICFGIFCFVYVVLIAVLASI